MRLNDFADIIYFINANNRTDRLIYMSYVLRKNKIHANRFKAIYGGNVINHDVDFSGVKKRIGRELNLAEKGCYYSHRELWKMLVNSPHENMIILEDDIIIEPTLESELDNFMSLNFKFDMFFFGQYNYDFKGANEYTGLENIGLKNIWRGKRCWLTHAYYVNKKTAEYLLQNTIFATTSIDGMMADVMKDLSVFAFAPAQIRQNMKIKSSLR